MVEETEKLATTAIKEEAENSSSMAKNHHNPEEEEPEAEEGEIVGGDPDDEAKAMAPPPPRHPLEHSWTFWFDNPSAKSKQQAWGSSIRPIYTFSSVEDFWRYFPFYHFVCLFSYVVSVLNVN